MHVISSPKITILPQKKCFTILSYEMNKAKEENHPLSVLLLTFEKPATITYQTLHHIFDSLQKTQFPCARVIQFGSHQLLMVLRNKNLEEAKVLAFSVKSIVEDSQFFLPPLRVNIGVSNYYSPQKEPIEVFIRTKLKQAAL
ncbi:MAG: hypothetical protein HYW47_08140 [Deltaproteobacteria bacterium]|nr:hypothetical protein [Deltaproteobacteria bacterium]